MLQKPRMFVERMYPLSLGWSSIDALHHVFVVHYKWSSSGCKWCFNLAMRGWKYFLGHFASQRNILRFFDLYAYLSSQISCMKNSTTFGTEVSIARLEGSWHYLLLGRENATYITVNKWHFELYVYQEVFSNSQTCFFLKVSNTDFEKTTPYAKVACPVAFIRVWPLSGLIWACQYF